MKRRVLCLLLAVLIFSGAVFCTVPTVYAASNLKISENIVKLIKDFEGFTPKPKEDYGQYTVGYGSACKATDYPNGITEEQADKLLRTELAKFEASVNSFATKYSLTLKQQQFDALVSFSFNLGTSWMSNDTAIRRAVVNGASGNEFLFAITQYSSVTENGEKKFMEGLAKRRLSEANVYLNGVYTKTVPSHYKYILFENILEDVVSLVRVQGYDSSKNDIIRAMPSKAGYAFLGWYTKKDGGEVVTTVGPNTVVTTLYAHWQVGDGKDSSGVINGVPAAYTYTPVSEQATYDVPNGKEVEKVAAGKSVSIVADYMDKSNVKWGKTAGGQWISLGKTGIQGAGSTAEEVNMTIKVTTDGVNVRTGPGTNYRAVKKVNHGTEITITHVQKVGDYKWGRYGEGWLRLDYTNYDYVSILESPDAQKVTAVGVIVGAEAVNIRNNPGTSGTTVVGSYKKGDVVKVTLQYKVGNTVWAMTEKGWVSTRYMELTSNGTTETKPGESTGSKVIAYGVIKGADEVRIRNNPGTSGTTIVGSYRLGDVISITEQKKVGNVTWAKTDKGWVSCYYVDVTMVPITPETSKPTESTNPSETTKPSESTNPSETTKPSESTNPSETTKPTEATPGVLATGIVDGCISLRVRSGSGTSYKEVDALAAGTSVNIYETKSIGSQVWGRIGTNRWVCLNYVEVEYNGYNKDSQRAAVVNCRNVNVRSAAGTATAVLCRLPAGTRVYIIDQKTVKDQLWYFTSAGWISGTYLQMVDDKDPEPTQPTQPGSGTNDPTQPSGGATVPTQPTTPTKRQLGTVSGTSTLKVRSAPGSNNKEVGKLSRGEKVIITETAKVGNVTWGKIGEGKWISLYYVTLSKTELSATACIKTVTASNLKIRAAAGANNKQVGSYSKGTKVVILQTTKVGNVTWGKTDKGWISLYYTK